MKDSEGGGAVWQSCKSSETRRNGSVNWGAVWVTRVAVSLGICFHILPMPALFASIVRVSPGVTLNSSDIG